MSVTAVDALRPVQASAGRCEARQNSSSSPRFQMRKQTLKNMRIWTIVATIGAVVVLSSCADGATGTAESPGPIVSSSSPSPTPTSPPDLSSLPAAQLSARAKLALKTARTLRVKGRVVEDGKVVALDLSYGRTGTAGAVTAEGHKIQLMLIGKEGYVKAPDSFYREQLGKEAGQALAVLSGKWVKNSASDPSFRAMAKYLSRKEVVGKVVDDWPAQLAKIGTKTVNGVECIGLKGSGHMLWIDKRNARPMLLESSPRMGESGTLLFSDYGKVTEPTPPPKSAVIDLSKAQG
jgi:hypothetical protein